MTLPPQIASAPVAAITFLGGLFALAEMLAAWRRGEYVLPGGLPVRRRERPGKFFAILTATIAVQLFFTAITILGVWSLVARPG